MLKSTAKIGAFALLISVGSSFATPTMAVADTASTAAIVAGVAAIVGTLVYDSNRSQYYYVRSGRRYYVANSTAQAWYQQRDPAWYNAHRGDFRSHPDRFDRDFRSSHHYPPHQ